MATVLCATIHNLLLPTPAPKGGEFIHPLQFTIYN